MREHHEDREVQKLVALQWYAELALLQELVGDSQEFPIAIFNVL